MTTLTGLPPLPRSLQGLFQGGSAHWKETERILQIRASIQQDICETQAQEWGGMTNGNGSPAGGRRTTIASLQATLAQLRREMVSLRQVDMSLLCQLWSLNESIQEYKHLMGDRMSETNSECSNYSLENGLDTIPSIEEENDIDALNSSMEDSSERIYQNTDATRTIERESRAPLTPPIKSQRSRTPPKQRPTVPPPAAPRAPDSPIPPPRTRTPPTNRSKPTLPHVPPPISRTPPGTLTQAQTKTPPLPQNPPPVNRTPPLPGVPPPVHRTPPPRNSTPPLPNGPPPVNRSTPTKRPSVPTAPPRRNRGTPPKNSQSSPSLSIRSSFSTTSNRSSAYGSDC